jgi:hypothetical protein
MALYENFAKFAIIALIIHKLRQKEMRLKQKAPESYQWAEKYRKNGRG